MHKGTPVLVTGGTGLVGSYILRYLLALGYTNIHASRLKNDFPKLIPDPQNVIKWIECDLTDRHGVYALVADRSHIIHAAGLVSYKRKDYDLLYEHNVEVTSTMVNAALDNDVTKFVHISSIDALMRKPGMTQIDESVGWEESNLTSNYARSKFLAEMEVWRGFHEGLSMMILNPSIVLGAGFWNNSSLKIIGNVAQGQRFAPSGTTGIVDVRDLARAAITTLFDADLHSKRLVVNGSNISFDKLLGSIATAIGAKKPAWRLTGWSQRMALFFLSVRNGLGFNNGLAPETLFLWSEDFHYPIERSEQYLGMTFTPLEQTISEVGQAFLESSEMNSDHSQLDLLKLEELFARIQI